MLLTENVNDFAVLLLSSVGFLAAWKQMVGSTSANASVPSMIGDDVCSDSGSYFRRYKRAADSDFFSRGHIST